MTVIPRVLLVEDEHDIALLIKHGLERFGDAAVDIVGSGDRALRAASEWVPSLIILDLNLPILSGTEVCSILRAGATTAHIPTFSLRELTARVRAVLRRSRSTGVPAPAVYQGRHLRADFDAVAISVDTEPVRLTRREFELLRHLVENRQRVISRDRLLERVWGYESSVETRSIDVHIGRLRAKLGVAGTQIETVVGLGYRFVE